MVRWHYQWIVVHEFLRTCGEAVVDDVLGAGRKFYKWHNEPFIPVEFSVAAYRFGHSQVRPSYRANSRHPRRNSVLRDDLRANRRRPAGPGRSPADRRAPRRFIDWPTFFDFGDGKVRPNKKIDTTLSTALFKLPGVGRRQTRCRRPIRLARQRNLLRHLTFSLPSGQRVAKA